MSIHISSLLQLLICTAQAHTKGMDGVFLQANKSFRVSSLKLEEVSWERENWASLLRMLLDEMAQNVCMYGGQSNSPFFMTYPMSLTTLRSNFGPLFFGSVNLGL